MLFVGAITALLAADSTKKNLAEPIMITESTPRPLYPFDALLNKKHGTISLECTVTPEGRMLHAKVIKADAPEFLAAILAYLEPQPFFVPSDAPKNDQGQPIIKYEALFDESRCGAIMSLMTCPPDSAMRIIAALRNDPTGNHFTKVKLLDESLVPLKQLTPTFPQSLREKTSVGSATIEFYIDEQGSAILPRIISATEEAFGYAACQAIASGWRFKPPLKNGKPTVTKVRVPVNFALKANAE